MHGAGSRGNARPSAVARHPADLPPAEVRSASPAAGFQPPADDPPTELRIALSRERSRREERPTAGLPVVPRVGVVGAGQLARMMWQAAVSLDLPLTVLAASEDDAAARAGAPAIVGAPDSLDALQALAAVSDVLTFDHEVIPPQHLAALVEGGAHLHPPPRANELAQDKARQRSSLSALGVPVPAHRRVRDARELEAFGEARGWPVVAKATRGGYDGRGVWVLDGPARAHEVASDAAGRGVELLVEEHVALDRELAVLVARRPGGQSVAYPVAETVQVDGMLRELVAPARVQPAVARRAVELAQRVAEAIGAVGILAVELFQVGPALLVNELALRPHNSGHWSIEGCVTSQFENHLRAVADWPLGASDPVAAAAATVNVIGAPDAADPRTRLPQALEVPGAHVHLYGKGPRPGRKLGHVTVLADSADEALASARRAAAILGGEPPPVGAPPDSVGLDPGAHREPPRVGAAPDGGVSP